MVVVCCLLFFVAMKGSVESLWGVGVLGGSRWRLFVEGAAVTGACCHIGGFGVGVGGFRRGVGVRGHLSRVGWFAAWLAWV